MGRGVNDAANGPTALQIVNLKTRVVTAVPGSSGLFSPKLVAGWAISGSRSTHEHMRLKLFDMNLHTWQDLAGDIKAGYPEWTPDSKCVVFGCSKGHGPMGIPRLPGRSERSSRSPT